jgi:hypothetical protein
MTATHNTDCTALNGPVLYLALELSASKKRGQKVSGMNGTSLSVNSFYERACVCSGRVFRGRYPSMIILLVAG